ncbi:hypothetical protein ACIBG8_42075 [Nonomuraea sp. NPDC050556]|uniref:hypothetical protein n=1 Tax=Nonomuraea sp. NPDC050556 TaxID=3364369 RepID=UPI00379762AF
MILHLAAAAAIALTPASLPDGFLLLEAQAKGHKNWSVDDTRTLPFVLNPCFKGHWDKGRLEARTVVYSPEGEGGGKWEQLIVYKDVSSAEAAMKGLRGQLAKCPPVAKEAAPSHYWYKPLDLGDDALRAGTRFDEGGTHDVVVRRGAAIMIYGQNDWPTKSLPLKGFRPLIKLAEEMLGQVCRLPEAAC